MKYNALSLFSSVGLAETYFDKRGIKVVVANEILKDRAMFHQHLYPESLTICGDILDKKIYNQIINESIKRKVDFIIATPPCQGMSTAGLMKKNDSRNSLIIPAVEIIKTLKPKFAIIENVPEQLLTTIEINNKDVLIPDYLYEELGNDYLFNENKVVNAMDYGVAQSRDRCVFLLSRKDQNVRWEFPKKSRKVVTMRDCIGDLPSLDPEITDISHDELLKLFPEYEKKKEAGLKVSKWHYPPRHKLRHVEAMTHTAEGQTAFDNQIYYPKLKDGTRSKGYKNTYKRQWWDKPAYTITRYTSRLGSQNNGHPGRLIKDDGTEEGRIYSDARVMSIYELMLLSSLPSDWNVPDWASDNLIRESIGEGIPPLLIDSAIKRICSKSELEKMGVEKND